MDIKKDSKRITAIVPAYNESERIGPVLDVLTSYRNFKEVIVIDDGSTDNTGDAARRYPVRYVRNDTNRGKGYSMDRAVRLAKGDIIFFCDADVKGLDHRIIDRITAPVLRGDTEMMIGMRNRKIYYMRFILAFIPLLGGERALTKRLWEMLPHYFKDKFKIEAGLNFYSKYYCKGFDYEVFKGLRQTIKEKKYGVLKGFKHRISMFYDIIAAQARLEFVDIPKNVKNRRLIIFRAVAESFGAVIGLLMVIAAQLGPVRFILSIFKKELVEDPNAPFVHFLLKVAYTTSESMILYLGIIIILNFSFLVMTLTRFLRLKKENIH